MLDNIKANLVGEQAAQKQVYDDQVTDCEAEVLLRQGECDEAESANKASKAAFDACTGALGQAELAEQVYEETTSNKRSALVKETALREAQKVVFEHMEKELESLLVSINTALDYVEDLEASQSTENVAGLLEVATVLTMGAISTNNFDKVTPFLVGFAQMSGIGDNNPYGVVGAESEDVAFLRQVLEDFHAQTTQDLVDLRSEESARVSTFATTKQTLEDIIVKLEAEIVEVKAHKFAMQTCIGTEQGIMDSSFEKFKRNEAILIATNTMCSGFESEY